MFVGKEIPNLFETDDPNGVDSLQKVYLSSF